MLLCAAPFVLVVDTTIVTVALPSIGRELGFSAASLHWVLASYALVFGGLLLLGGRVGDLLGHRRMLRAGAALFAAASAAGALAATPWILLAARAVQGVGAAALMPAALALVNGAFEQGQERERALGVYSGAGALGAAAGVTLGGALTQLAGWRWVLAVGVPIALTAFLVPPAAAPGHPGPAASRRLDLPGAASVTLGLGAWLYALTEARSSGWTAPVTLGLLAAGTGLLAGFVAVERRSPAPLVPLAAFRDRPVTVANVAILLESATAAYAYVLTRHLQEVRGLSPLATGLCFLPLAVAAAVAAPVAGRLVGPLGSPRPVVRLGLVVQGSGLLLMAAMLTAAGIGGIIAGSVIWAVGKVMVDVALTIVATSGSGGPERGLAAGLLNTSQQLGAAWGLGVVAAVVVVGGELRWGLLAAAGFVAVALAVVLPGLPREGHRRVTGRR